MAANGLFWWIGAGVLVLLELMSGTFYLLMVAVGFIAGGIAHLFGAGLEIELLVAALVAMIAVTVLRRSKLGHVTRRDASHDPGVNLDIGETLKVNEWHEGRGAEWDIELAPGETEGAHMYRITAFSGNTLVVAATR
jgi:membrane protein implicated in regulation of membrane protease activity